MLPDRVSNPGPLTYESDALLIALRGPAHFIDIQVLELTGANSRPLQKLHLFIQTFSASMLQCLTGPKVIKFQAQLI